MNILTLTTAPLKWHKTVFRTANITDISKVQTMFNSIIENLLPLHEHRYCLEVYGI